VNPALPLAMLAFAVLAPAESYVPHDIARVRDQVEFYEHWFGGPLRTMEEPSFSRADSLGEFRRRFRLVVLPSFHPAYAIRIDESRDGSAQVRIARLDQRREGTRIAESESFVLAAAALQPVDEAIDAAALRSRRGEPSSGSCTDGVTFVFELVDEAGRVFVHRHQCSLNATLLRLVRHVDALRRTVGSDLPGYLNES